MISIQRGYEDWKELSGVVRNVKTLNTFVDLVDGNNRYGITNDLRETHNCIDLNYKSICATIEQKENGLSLSPSGVEVWNDDGSLDMIYIDDILKYENYNVELLGNGEIKILHKNKQDYYAIGTKIYKDKICIKDILINKTDRMTEIDIMILELMKME